MPVLPIIADTLRVSVEGLATNNHQWANVLHFRKTGALTFTGAIAILDPILLGHYQTANGGGIQWRQHAATTASLQRFRYLPLDGTSAQTVITHALAGLDTNDPLPASQSLVVTLRTLLRGRSRRGRAYQGPWTEFWNTAGLPIATAVAGLATQWSFLINTSLPGTGLSLVVASYRLVSAQDVTSVSVNGRWDTQRRRLNA